MTDTGTIAQVQETVGDKAREVAGTAQDRARQEAGTRSTQVGSTMTSVARAMRQAGDDLRGEGQDAPANAVHGVADRTDRLGTYLTDVSGDQLLHDLEDLGRRQPVLVIAGGFMLGLAAARFLRASSSDRYARRSSYPRSPYAGSAYSGSSYPTGSSEPGSYPYGRGEAASSYGTTERTGQYELGKE